MLSEILRRCQRIQTCKAWIVSSVRREVQQQTESPEPRPLPALQYALGEYLLNGSVKGSMKYWGLLPQLPSEVSVPSKTSQPSVHPVCSHFLHSGDVITSCGSTFAFWMVLIDGPVTSTLWFQLCPLPTWKVVSLSEPSPGCGWMISRTSVIAHLDDSDCLKRASLLLPLPYSAYSQLRGVLFRSYTWSCPTSSQNPPVAFHLRGKAKVLSRWSARREELRPPERVAHRLPKIGRKKENRCEGIEGTMWGSGFITALHTKLENSPEVTWGKARSMGQGRGRGPVE